MYCPSHTRQHWYEDMGVSIDQADSVELIRSHESASGIMESWITGTPYRFSANVMNEGKLITNLPDECCVEVPCIADGNGLHPFIIGDLPTSCSVLCRSNIGYQELAVRAIREKSKDIAFQSLLMDPITQSKLTIKQARDMFEEMWAAEADLLTYYA
jgi:alpha-galactosidase